MRSTFKSYCIFYFFYYITLGVYSPYLNVYYERLGFSGSQIGNINSLGLLFAMFITPLWGVVSDKTKKHKLVLATAVISTAVMLYIWSLQRSFISVLVTAIFLHMCRSDIGSLADSMCIKFCNEYHYDYSIIRALGSFGYVFGCFALGNFASYLGYNGPYVYIFCICSAVALLCITRFPKEDEENAIKQEEPFNLKDDGKQLIKNKDFIYALLLMVLSSAVMDVITGYVGNHLVITLKQSDALIGISTLAMVAPEVIIVMKAQKIFDKLGYRNLYLLGCGTQVLRLLVYAFIPNIFAFLLVSTFHGFAIAAICVGNVNFLYRTVDRKLLATGMSIYNAGYIISTAAFNQLFGTLYETRGSGSMFFIAALISLIGLLMVIFSKRLSVMDKPMEEIV